MIQYLVTEKGLSREDAYMLCSLAGDLKIAETVDVPHMHGHHAHAQEHIC